MRSLYLLLGLCLLAVTGRATNYYNLSNSATLQSVSQWGQNPDGTGANPANFTTAGDVFYLVNGTSGTISAAWTITGVTLNVGDGVHSIMLTIPSTFALSGSGRVNVLANATLTLEHTTIPTLGALDVASTVDYASAAGGQTIASAIYGNLKMSNTSGTQTAGGNITVNGGLTTNGGGTMAMVNYVLDGALTSVANNGTITTTNTSATPIPSGLTWGGTVSYISSVANQTVRKGTYTNLIIGSSSTRTFTADGNMTINGDLIFGVATATFADGGFIISLAGDIAGAAGKHAGTGKIVMTGAGATIIGSSALGNVEFNNAAGFTLLGSTAFGNMAFTAGALNIGSNTLTIGGTVVGMSPANCLVSNGSSNITVSATTAIGTLYFDQTTPGTSNSIATFTCSGAGGTTTIGNALQISATLALSSSTATIADGGNTITLLGNITGTGKHSGTGEILMTGAGATISGLSATGNINLNNAAGFGLSGNTSVNGIITFTAGQLNIGANTLTIATNGGFAGMDATNCLVGGTSSNFTVSSTGSVGPVYFDMSNPGISNYLATLTCSGANGTTTLANDVTVGTTLALSTISATLNDGGNTVTVLGNITGTGKHTGAGKILMTGANKNISGLTGTGNLELDNNGSFNATGNISCNGTLTFTSSTLTLGAFTFSILTNGSVSGMSSSKFFTGGPSSNFTVNTTGTTGTIFFDQTTPGISNNISTFTNAAGATTLGTDLAISTGLTLTAGTFNDNGNTVTVSGNISGTNGAHIGTGKILMIGSGKTISASAGGLANLELSNAGGFSLAGTTIVNGVLTFTNGKLSLNTKTLMLNGTVAGMSAANCVTGSASAILTVNADDTLGTLYFDQTTPGTSNNIGTFTNAAGTTVLGNAMSIGNITLTAGTLYDNGNVISLTGSITGSGTHASGVGGKISMTGLAKSISGVTLGNVEFKYTSAASAFTLTGNPTISGNLAFTGASNTLTIGAHTITLNGTISGSSTTNYFTGGTTSNIVVGSTGALGTIFLSQVSGTTRTLQTLTVNGGGSVTMGSISTVSTTLALTNGTLNDGGLVMTLSGNITGTGTHTSSPGGKITMTGASKSISGATLGNLELSNNSAFTLTGSPTITGALTFTNGTLAVGNNTLTLAGTVAGMSTTKYITGGASSNLTVTSAGAVGSLFFDQIIAGTSNNFSTFTINNLDGIVTLGSALSAGTLALTAGTLAGAANVIAVTGNITGSGTHTSTGAGVINMTGANATISGATLGNLTINNASGFNLTGSPTVSGTLTLTSGRLDLGSYDLTLLGAGPIAGTLSASNMIVTSGSGQLRKAYSANGSYTFPVGDNAGNFTPVVLNVTSGTYGGGAYVGVSTTNTKHPQNSNANNYLKRYWTVNTSNITSPVYSLTATYVPGDIVGTESSISGAKYTGSLPWAKFSTLSSNTLTTSAISNGNVAISGVAGATPTVTASGNVTICSGGSTNLSVVSSTGSPVLAYTWAPATGLSSTMGSSVAASPTVTTTYTLTVTDGNGETAMSQTTITVTPAPSASPANNGYICNGGTVNLTANPSGSTTTYSWEGANLSATTVANPSATPVSTSIYTLTVTNGTSNAGCSVDFTTTVNVHAVPSATPTNNGYICNGGTVTLSANPANGASAFNWVGSNLGSNTEQNPTATPTTNAIYTLTVTDGSNQSGCAPTTQYTTAVTVTTVPTAAPSNNGYICNGGTVTLMANPAGSTNVYAWTGSNLSSSTAQNPTATPTSSTIYTLTVSDGSGQPGCASTTQYTTAVTVKSAPTAAPSNDGYICNGGTVNLSANPTGAATIYTWSGTNLSSGTAQNPSATPTSSTIYTLTVSDGSGQPGCSPSTEYTTAVTVNAVPIAAPTNGGPICNGSTATLTANPENGANTYAWIGSNLSSTSAQDPTATPNASTVYTLTVSDGSGKSGCSPATQYTTAVTVNSVPTAAPTSDGPICVGGTVHLTANPTGGATVYNWSGPNLSSATDQNPTATPVTNTVYTLTVSDGSAHPGCTPTSQYTVSVTVAPAPSLSGASNIAPLCTSGPLNLLANGPANVTGYSWVGPNSFTSTLQNPSIPSASAAAAGTYSVIVNNGTGNGCSATYTTTAAVLTSPVAAITGTFATCEGNSTVLANATVGGSWISSNASIATIGSSTGAVQGITAGNATITYKIGASGCFVTAEVTVNAQPAAITGASSLCYASTTSLANAVTGGVWSTSNTTVAPIDPVTGVLTGGNPGSATITYTMGAGTGCRVTKPVTVNSLPGLVPGTTLCEGKSATLTNTGGVWSSGDVGTAIVGASTGVVTGMLAGNVNITYTLPTGCYRYGVMTVNQSPAAITGPASLCMGNTITLANAVSGGTWSSSGGATIGSTDGILTGVLASAPTVSYTLANGCRVTAPVTVNTVPGAFGGNSVVCAASTLNLSNNPSGGVWSSSDVSLATVGTSGVVTGVGGGNPVISYTLPTGCYNTKTITVNPIMPIAGGANGVCVGSTITLHDAVAGGAWSSSNPSRATIDATTGVVNGIAAGATSITYTMPTGCRYVLNLPINPISAITGTPMACEGLTTTLADATAGGSWSSTDASVATVGTSGIVTGGTAGNTTISYLMPTGCLATTGVTINQAPVAITGGSTVCAGSILTLSDAVSGGTWSSSNTAVATVGSATGVVTAVAGGTVTITYSNGPGCSVTKVITVSPILPITGTNSACLGMTTTLSCGSSGGTWSSSNVGVATIGTSGVVSGLTQGVTTVTYALPSGCARTVDVSVNPVPASITGPSTVCASLTAPFSGDNPGGTWSSSNAAIATVGSSTGLVTGVAAGSAMITYTMGLNCRVTKVVTVNSSAAITGTAKACIGTSTTFSHSVMGGTWESANTSIATIGISDGVATGVASGTTTITYTPPTGCLRTVVVTINALPGANSGTPVVCVGSTTVVTNATPGGVSWASSEASVASIGASSGIVTGVSAGTATITYNVNTGCYATSVVTVNPIPSGITGGSSVCVASSITLGNTMVGGTWSSSNVALATVGSTDGIVSGLSAGTPKITYTLSTGCYSLTTLSVLGNAVNTGTASLCVGTTATLSNTTTGGTWTTSDATIATVGAASGIVTGVAAGNADITYINPSGCVRVSQATVNTTPAAITGSQSVCVGFATSLASVTSGGVWNCSSATVASIGTSGVVTALAAGTANVSYTLGSCRSIATITVNSLPSAITGTTSVCEGFTTGLGNATPGGTWSSSNSSVASVGVSGIVNGVSAGAASVTYTLPTGCYKAVALVVNATPSALTGNMRACPGTTTVVGSATSGGQSWTSSNTAVATIGSTSGIVTGMIPGTTTITYTLGTGCYVTGQLTINPNPVSITGAGAVCPGRTLTLADADAGGTWSSVYLPVTANDGIVTGVGSGARAVTYTLPTGCITTVNVFVNPVADITGNTMVCVGAIRTLANAVTGGTWSSSNAAIATIGASNGALTAVSSGTSTISYTTPAGCIVTRDQTVNALASSGTITGATTVIAGLQVTLSDDISGGVWSTNDNSIATIESTTGIVTGVAAGNAVISYTVNNGCGSITGTYIVSVASSRHGNNEVANNTTAGFTVFPNPNKGEFTVKGVLAEVKDQDIYAEVTNVLGQVVYRENMIAHNGVLEQKVNIGKALSNGMYTLKLSLPGENKVFHFVINQ